jgi:AhpD family alkylhydroperoxidase
MEARLNLMKVAPKGAYQAMAALQQYVDSCGLERQLLELVKIRSSQINGCAYCIDMHTKDARALGESEQRIYLLSAWRESPFYTDRERAALEWAEALTLISEGHVPDDVYARASKQFSPEELVNLSVAVATINSWNRLAIPFRAVPGEYQSHLKPLKASA